MYIPLILSQGDVFMAIRKSQSLGRMDHILAPLWIDRLEHLVSCAFKCASLEFTLPV